MSSTGTGENGPDQSVKYLAGIPLAHGGQVVLLWGGNLGRRLSFFRHTPEMFAQTRKYPLNIHLFTVMPFTTVSHGLVDVHFRDAIGFQVY